GSSAPTNPRPSPPKSGTTPYRMKKALKATNTAASQNVAHVGRRKRRPSGDSGTDGSNCVSTSSDSPGRSTQPAFRLTPRGWSFTGQEKTLCALSTQVDLTFRERRRCASPTQHTISGNCRRNAEARLSDSYRLSIPVRTPRPPSTLPQSVLSRAAAAHPKCI